LSGKKKNDSAKKRDDSYFAAGRRRNKKYMMIIIPIIVAVVGAGIAAAVLAPKNPALGFGPLGSAHLHAVFAVVLEGEAIDFSQDKYQVRTTGNQYIHVEGGDGTTLHKHSTMVPVGEFLRSVGMDIRDNCFIRDDGEQFCEQGNNQLRYYRNATEIQSIMDYSLQDNDRLLIIYGDETDAEIQAEISKLMAIEIRK
jgi:hypothetical protein